MLPETFTITGVVPSFASPGSFINSSFKVSSDTPDSNPSNNADSDSAQVQTWADVGVQLTTPPIAVAGTQVTFTVVYSNAGPSNAINAQGWFTTPSNFPIAAVPAGWITTAVNVAQLSVPTFVAGSLSSHVITVSLPATAVPAFNPFNASINALTPDQVPGNNSTGSSVNVTRSADVSITVSAPDSIENSTAYIYTVVMTNFGPSSLPNQQFTVNWSPAVKTLVLVSPGWISAPALGSGKVAAATFTSGSSLAAGASTTVIVSIITPKKGNSLSATFNVATPGANDPSTGNNSTTKITSLNPVPITAITLTASSSTVISGTAATFTATIGPESASWDITYNWSATNQSSVTPIITESDEITQTFTWTTLGPQVVTVTASNGGTPVTATRIITVTPVNLTSVVISTPVSIAPVGTPMTFTADVLPTNANLPITYTWTATNQSPQTFTGGGLTSGKVFTWSVLGPQVVTVTATNAGNTVTNTFVVTATPVNLTNVVISTPVSTAPVGSAFTFTATSSPANATQPITYAWSRHERKPADDFRRAG